MGNVPLCCEKKHRTEDSVEDLFTLPASNKKKTGKKAKHSRETVVADAEIPTSSIVTEEKSQVYVIDDADVDDDSAAEDLFPELASVNKKKNKKKSNAKPKGEKAPAVKSWSDADILNWAAQEDDVVPEPVVVNDEAVDEEGWIKCVSSGKGKKAVFKPLPVRQTHTEELGPVESKTESTDTPAAVSTDVKAPDASTQNKRRKEKKTDALPESSSPKSDAVLEKSEGAADTQLKKRKVKKFAPTTDANVATPTAAATKPVDGKVHTKPAKTASVTTVAAKDTAKDTKSAAPEGSPKHPAAKSDKPFAPAKAKAANKDQKPQKTAQAASTPAPAAPAPASTPAVSAGPIDWTEEASEPEPVAPATKAVKADPKPVRATARPNAAADKLDKADKAKAKDFSKVRVDKFKKFHKGSSDESPAASSPAPSPTSTNTNTRPVATATAAATTAGAAVSKPVAKPAKPVILTPAAPIASQWTRPPTSVVLARAEVDDTPLPHPTVRGKRVKGGQNVFAKSALPAAAAAAMSMVHRGMYVRGKAMSNAAVITAAMNIITAQVVRMPPKKLSVHAEPFVPSGYTFPSPFQPRTVPARIISANVITDGEDSLAALPTILHVPTMSNTPSAASSTTARAAPSTPILSALSPKSPGMKPLLSSVLSPSELETLDDAIRREEELELKAQELMEKAEMLRRRKEALDRERREKEVKEGAVAQQA